MTQLSCPKKFRPFFPIVCLCLSKRSCYTPATFLSPQDFSHLVAATPDAVTFLKAEEDKRQVEYYQAKLFRLNYEDASFRLDFHPIEINDSTQTATVRVDEWQEIVFEVSSPVVSKAHIEHTFSLLLEDNEWRIVSDNYLDPVRRFLNVTGYSKDEAIQSLDDQNAATQHEAQRGPAAVIQGGREMEKYLRYLALIAPQSD